LNSYKKLSDQEVLDLLARKDDRSANLAFNAVYEKGFRMVSSFIRKNGGTEDEALDIFQDTVIIFYKHLQENRFRKESSIATYLYSIARNLWYLQLRKKNRIQYQEEVEDQEDLAVELDSEKISIVDMIGELLEQLDAECKKTLKMFYFQKNSMSEIQNEFGLSSEQSAKTKKYRCMKKLEELFVSCKIDRDRLI